MSMCNRRTLAAVLLICAAGVLEGCVYNPYTGTYTPCCAAYPAYGGYGYPGYGGAYGYPANGGYYGAPQGGAYQGQGYPGQGTPGPGYQRQGYQGPAYQGQGYQGQAPTP